MGPLLQTMTQAVRQYAMEQQRVPKSLQEVADAGRLASVPEPPPGKKFMIDKKLNVVLVDK